MTLSVVLSIFVPVPKALKIPQQPVFVLYLAEGKIEPEVVENMRSWQHSGVSVDQSVFLPAWRRFANELMEKKASGRIGTCMQWSISPSAKCFTWEP